MITKDKELSIQIWLDKILKNLNEIDSEIKYGDYNIEKVKHQYHLISLIKNIIENKTILIGDNIIKTYLT